jgi:tetratricopeptide (TPR) repeat protein
MGKTRRALEWYRKLFADDPNDAEVAVDLINLLGRQKEWGEAAIVLKKQIDLLGQRPGVLFAYGWALFEAGDFNGAIDALGGSLKLGGNETMITQARELRDRAFELGGKAIPPAPPKPATGPVSRKEFETALKEFGNAISKNRRMAFWRRKDGKRVWAERPERLAQQFLHIFLQAKFVERTEIEGEVIAGAGRIDLFVKLIGNMSIVVEIKMCGLGYSSRYAAAGEQQITHYMKNRATQLGYLLVFDGRTKSNGKRVLPRRSGSQTVLEYSVDVSPEVKSRPNSGKHKRTVKQRRASGN